MKKQFHTFRQYMHNMLVSARSSMNFLPGLLQKSVFFVLPLVVLFALVSTYGPQEVDTAAPPTIITYQGKLLSSGASVTTTQTMGFILYDSLTDGTAVYTAAGTLPSTSTVSITPTSGIFSVDLGAGSTNALSPEIFNTDSLYLEVWVDGTVLTPRKRLTALPYAINSSLLNGVGATSTASTSTYIPISGSDGSFDFNTTTVSYLFGTTVSTTDLYVGGTITGLDSSDLSDASNIALLNAEQTFTGLNTFSATTSLASTTIGGTLNVDSGTFYVDVVNNRVGINSSTPYYGLSVNGTGFFTGTTTVNNNLFVGALVESVSDENFALNGDDAYFEDLVGIGNQLYVENTVWSGGLVVTGNGSVSGTFGVTGTSTLATSTIAELTVTNGVTIGGVRRTSWPSGGGSGAWSTSTGIIYPADTGDVVLIGASSTSTSSLFEVNGASTFEGTLTVTEASTLATSTIAELTVTNGVTIGGVRRTSWPSTSGSGAWSTSSGLIYPADTGDAVVIGASSTSTDSIFEVNGTSTFSGYTNFFGNATSPVFLGGIDSPGASSGSDIKVKGDYAYLAKGSYGLDIIDITDPSNLEILGNYDRGAIDYIDVQGNYAYVTVYSSGVDIVDISNSATPTLAATFSSTGATLRDVFVSGDKMYLAKSADGIEIVDISNPYEPVLLGTYAGGGDTAYTVTVSGDYAYIGTNGGVSGVELSVVDVSDPTNPILVGSDVTLTGGQGFKDIEIVGKYAYVAADGDGLAVFDISKPADPTFIATSTYTGTYPTNIDGLAISGNYAYVVKDTDGISVIDISDPDNMVGVGTVSTTGSFRSWKVDILGNRLYLANGFRGLDVFDIGSVYIANTEVGTAKITRLDTLGDATFNNNVSVEGGLSVGNNGLFLSGDLAFSRPTSSLAVTNTLRFSHTALFKSVASSSETQAFVFDTQNTVDESTGYLLSLRNNGVEKFTFTATGTLGIGENSPDASLHITRADGGVVDDIILDAGGGFQNNEYRNVAFKNNSEVIGRVGVGFPSSGSIARFVVSDLYNTGAQDSDIFVVQGDGKVGIGVAAPDFNLSVSGTTYISSNLFVGANTSTITTSSFVMNGDDAYIEDLLGVGDSLYVENAIHIGTSSLHLSGDVSGGQILMTDGPLNIDSADGLLSFNANSSQDVLFSTLGGSVTVGERGFDSVLATTTDHVTLDIIGDGFDAFVQFYTADMAEGVLFAGNNNGGIQGGEFAGLVYNRNSVTYNSYFDQDSLNIVNNIVGNDVDTKKIALIVSSTETLTVTEGSIGINSTTPNYNLSVVGTANITGNTIVGGDLSITGDTIFTGNVDLTGNILNPVPVGNIATGVSTIGYAGIDIKGDTLYVAKATQSAINTTQRSVNRLEIYNVADKSNISQVVSVGEETPYVDPGSGLDISPAPLEMLQYGPYLITVTQASQGGIQIIDVSDPGSVPAYTVVSKVPDSVDMSSAADIYLQGNYLYVASTGNDSVMIYDLTNVEDPELVATVDYSAAGAAFAGPWTIQVRGRYAYVGHQGGAIDVLDVSDPENPVRRGNIEDGDGGALLSLPIQMDIVGDYAYTAAFLDNAMTILDISDPDDPTYIGSVASSTGLSGIVDVEVVGDYVIAGNNNQTNGESKITIIDASDPTSPSIVQTIDQDGSNLLQMVIKLRVEGNYLYVTSAGGNSVQGGVQIYDIGSATLAAAEIGSIRVNTLSVDKESNFYRKANFASGLQIGSGGFMNYGDATFFASPATTTDYTGSATNMKFTHTANFLSFASTSQSEIFSFNTKNVVSDATKVWSVSNSSTELLTVVGNGNVGIASSTPNYKLVVDGTAYFGATTTIATNLLVGGVAENIDSTDFVIDDGDAFVSDMLGVGNSLFVKNKLYFDDIASVAVTTTNDILFSTFDNLTLDPSGSLVLYGDKGVYVEATAASGVSVIGTGITLASTASVTVSGTKALFMGGTTVMIGATSTASTPGEELDIEGQIQFNINTSGDNQIGVCKSTADGTSNNTEFVECAGDATDLAELYDTLSDVQAGDIVMTTQDTITYEEDLFDPFTGLPVFTGSFDTEGNQIRKRKSTTIAVLQKAKLGNPSVIGVVSTNPSKTLGNAVKDVSLNPQPVAIVGRVPVNINNTGGEIIIGDPISLSEVDGEGKKAAEGENIIGIALESGAGQAQITVALTPGASGLLGAMTQASNTELNTIQESASSNISVVVLNDRLKVVDTELDVTGLSIVNVAALFGKDDNWRISQEGYFVTSIDTEDGKKDFYSLQSEELEIVLSGTGQLTDGQAIIAFDSIYKDILDEDKPVKVTVTLTDEANGIYVSDKSVGGFIVHELNDGNSEATFDWLAIVYRDISDVAGDIVEEFTTSTEETSDSEENTESETATGGGSGTNESNTEEPTEQANEETETEEEPTGEESTSEDDEEEAEVEPSVVDEETTEEDVIEEDGSTNESETATEPEPSPEPSVEEVVESAPEPEPSPEVEAPSEPEAEPAPEPAPEAPAESTPEE